MKMTEGQIVATINEFVDTELAQLASGMSMKDQFIHGFKLGIAKRKIPGIVHEQLASPMLLDADGKLDADMVFESAIESMNRVHQVELAGFSFNTEDLQKLRDIAAKHAGG